jgi:hypothetical protein
LIRSNYSEANNLENSTSLSRKGFRGVCVVIITDF